MTYGDVAKIGSFAVPASTIEVTPGEGQPGDMITLTAGNMPVYTEVDYVEHRRHHATGQPRRQHRP